MFSQHLQTESPDGACAACLCVQLCVQENYRNNPFHNFRHCFCVTQMMYGFIHLCGLLDQLSVEDMAVLITACVCHDLDHPGYNNT